ncbi:hypothetical protein SAMN04488109_4735 [Chryseolinea serpens]|uniref:Uncharacterized protein n=1 Tax=Chryseolinea serpens TaxID=947013 RepID=A0A1M5UK57_9BACT|nr:hypothetical protein [Chryseolinea serpens]SHH63268.1 hypothetical protein SAMN04488109_4735 [Chryseolinea serpens]
MKRLLLLSLLIASCGEKKAKLEFEQEKWSPYQVYLKNYQPVTEAQFNDYMSDIQRSIKLDSFHVFLLAENINDINPEFKKKFFRGILGREDLERAANDSAKVLRNLRIGFGVYENGKFLKNDFYDSLILNNQFFKH